MLLIDASKLVQVEAASADSLVIMRRDFPNGFQVVQGPIKVKLAKDMLVVVSSSTDDAGKPKLHVDILKSTARKFQTEYVSTVLKSKLASYSSSEMKFAEMTPATY